MTEMPDDKDQLVTGNTEKNLQSSPINEDAEDAQEAVEPTVRSPHAESSLSSPHSAHDGEEESAPALQLEAEQKNE